MNWNKSRKDKADRGPRKPVYTLVVVSVLAAFVIAALPLSSVFAAPTGPGEGGNDSWQSKVDKLRAEISIAQNLQTQPGTICGSSEQAKYRDQYITTLRAAQGVVVSGASSTIPVTGSSSNSGTSASGNNASMNGVGKYYANHPEKLLAAYLHRLRQLRQKMTTADTTNANNKSCTATGTGTGSSTGTGAGTGTGTSTGTGTATSTPAPSTTPTATP